MRLETNRQVYLGDCGNIGLKIGFYRKSAGRAGQHRFARFNTQLRQQYGQG